MFIIRFLQLSLTTFAMALEWKSSLAEVIVERLTFYCAILGLSLGGFSRAFSIGSGGLECSIRSPLAVDVEMIGGDAPSGASLTRRWLTATGIGAVAFAKSFIAQTFALSNCVQKALELFEQLIAGIADGGFGKIGVWKTLGLTATLFSAVLLELSQENLVLLLSVACGDCALYGLVRGLTVAHHQLK